MSGTNVYRKEDLNTKPNIPGALMWAVGLRKSMLTYFELEPTTAFPHHAREAEQITLVLEGELTFLYGRRTVTLKSMEVVAILSNIAHSVAGGSRKCRAVDAWSSVREEYLEDADRGDSFDI